MEDKKKSRIFEVASNELTLKFEFFSIDYIYNQLEGNKKFYSVHRFVVPESRITRDIHKFCIDNSKRKMYQYFSYIKFFECDGTQYGLVGGKTNYSRPDISFDYLSNENDNRIGRNFLETNNYKWTREIIIINHQPFEETERLIDSHQALFIEKYVQRQFNLLDS